VDAALRALTLGRKRPRATLRRRGLVEAFTERELRRWVIAPSGLRRLQPLDLTLSPESWENVMRHTRRGLVSRTGEPYPHVLVQAGRSVFTSACVVLEKPVSSQGA